MVQINAAPTPEPQIIGGGGFDAHEHAIDVAAQASQHASESAAQSSDRAQELASYYHGNHGTY